MSCLITSGVGITCADLRVVGGVNKVAYIYNFDELVDVNYDSNGYIDDINFTSYDGLHKFVGRKSAHSGGYTAQIQSPGGNKFYSHDVTIKLFPGTPAEDEVIENLLVATTGIILETNNDEFFLYGLKNGMDQTEGTQTTGQEAATDTSDTLTFVGEEPKKPSRILIGGSAEATKNFLETLVV